MNKAKNIVTFGVLIALYVALSFCMKFTVIGNIQIDLGYVVFAVACCVFGAWGFVVGAFGCMIESILFSAYGFSLSWFIANVIIGILCGTTYMVFKEKHFVWRMFFTFIAVLMGVGIFKTGIECYLYNISLAVKLPKNIVATVIDTIAMWIGLWIYPMIKKNIR